VRRVLAAGVLALTLASSAGALDAGHATGTGEPPTDLVARGQELFLTGCASCHGAAGQGAAQGPTLVGVGAASADFMLTTGRMPATNPDTQSRAKPPAFRPREIDALVAYVASLGEGPPIPDVQAPPGDLSEGGVLYRSNCQACHSAAGNGGALTDGVDAPTLHGADAVQIAEAARIGPGSMPVFGPDTFTDAQVNSIVRYVRRLDNPEDRGGLSLGRVGPVTEGLVALGFGLVLLALLSRWIEPKEHHA